MICWAAGQTATPIRSNIVLGAGEAVLNAAWSGPIAWQIHNKGLFDEYKDVRIEINPTTDDLITTK